MRLIDADALMKEFAVFVRASNQSDFADVPTWNDAVSLVGSAPTIEERKNGEWIPVSERLPDEDLWTGMGKQYSADVLITVHNADDEETIIDYGHTIDGAWYSDTTDCIVPSEWKVIAWMPLPEPYRSEA